MVQCDPETIDPPDSGTFVEDHRKFPDVKPGISLRLTPEDSARHWDEDEDRIKAFIGDRLGGSTEPERIQVMKWRYANSAGVVKEPFFEVKAGPVSIAVCGDAFLAGQAEGTEAALMSAAAAFDFLI